MLHHPMVDTGNQQLFTVDIPSNNYSLGSNVTVNVAVVPRLIIPLQLRASTPDGVQFLHR